MYKTNNSTQLSNSEDTNQLETHKHPESYQDFTNVT